MGVKECKDHILGQGVCTFLTNDAVALPLVTAQLKINVKLQRNEGVWNCKKEPSLEN